MAFAWHTSMRRYHAGRFRRNRRPIRSHVRSLCGTVSRGVGEMIKFHGIFPPIPTPFDASGGLDVDALDRNLAWWNEHDLTGYVLLGSNGEAVHLEEVEKLALIARVRAALPDARSIIAGTALASTGATVDLTTAAAEAGADAALVLPPFFYKSQMTAEALVAHFATVADRSPVPILLYNMPANTGIDIDPTVVVELSKHERIAGIKDSSGNVAKLGEIRRATDPAFAILAGSASFLLPALAIGADGGILALANIAPEVCSRIARLAERGDWREAAELQRRIIRANAAVTRRWGVPGLKGAMDLLGLAGGPPRPPLLPLSEDRRSALREILIDAAILKEAQ